MPGEPAEVLDLDRQEPDHAGGMGVPHGNEPANRQEDTAGRLTLSQRIAAIRKEAANVGKDDIKMKTKAGAEYTIKGHTIEAVLASIRPLLDKYQVLIMPSLESVSYNGNRCDVIYSWAWEALDNPEDMRIIRWPGADTDMGGKALAKAGTNSLKEMLKKTLQITDRDDNEEETKNVDYRSDEGLQRDAVEQAKEAARKNFEAWARTYIDGIKTKNTEADLKRFKAENASQLNDPALPAVTKKYINQTYDDRLAVLKEFEAEES